MNEHLIKKLLVKQEMLLHARQALKEFNRISGDPVGKVWFERSVSNCERSFNRVRERVMSLIPSE